MSYREDESVKMYDKVVFQRKYDSTFFIWVFVHLAGMDEMENLPWKKRMFVLFVKA